MKTYKINGKEIKGFNIPKDILGEFAPEHKIDELLEALSDKEEHKHNYKNHPSGCMVCNCEEEPKQEILEEMSDGTKVVSSLPKQEGINICRHGVPLKRECFMCKEDKKCNHKEKYTEEEMYLKDLMDNSSYKLCEDCKCYVKQEECLGCEANKETTEWKDVIKHTCKPKQSTSLKEKIYSKIIDYSYQETTTEETVNEILKLIQSHLLKEMPEEKDVQFEVFTSDVMARRMGYNDCIRDIIKIINNIK